MALPRLLVRHLVEIVESHNVKIRLNHEMSEAVHVVSRVIPKIVLLRSAEEIDAERLKIDGARQRYDAAWAALQAMPASPAGQIRRAEIRTAGDAARQFNTQTIELARTDHDHDAVALLRTPMAGVLGIADLLGRTTLDETQRHYVKTIVQSGRSLMALLNDILDLSKVEAGRLSLEKRAVDLAAVLQGSIDLMAPRASGKGLALSLDVAQDLNLWVSGDPLRLQQVLNNLIGNAIKFTARGAVQVSLRAAPQLGAQGYRLCVQDSGPGIAAPALARLFQPFSQADATTARRYGGSGLGLVIARRIAEAMGGTLSVDSTVGVGSTFCFTVVLPAAEPHLRRPDPADSVLPADAGGASTPAAAALAVLLVEDNPVNQLYCRAVLEQLGHAVDVANDGREAVRMAEQRNYDLILMDCHMPVLDGFDATRQIRQADARRGAPQRPIVALTAAAMAEDLQHCLDAGMDSVLTKPFCRVDLEALLRRVAIAPDAALIRHCVQ